MSPKLRLSEYKPEKLLEDLAIKPESYWASRGQKKALELFRGMSQRVPAYKDFLKKRKVNPEKIKTFADFQFVPPLDKQSYLRQYSLEKLCWDGKLSEGQWTIASTSGTSGEPFYFPRTAEQDAQYALTAELYLRTNFEIQKKSTLYINGFALGVWIGGLFTYESIRLLSKKGNYNLSLINPGLNKAEIIKALKNLGHLYDQVIIGGYPPFIKDTVDDATEAGINWKKYNLGFIFSAEGFSEKFRDYIIKKTGLKNPHASTLNHYGTVDLGTMAHETPLSVLIRRQAMKDKELYQSLFHNANRLPTFAQYLPEMFYFEEISGSLYCSAFSGLPLARYDLKDRGGVIGFDKVKRLYQNLQLDLGTKINHAGIGKTVWNLPFVYVYERNDLSVVWYGANIHPEHIKTAHEYKDLHSKVSGKFTMQIVLDRKHNPILTIHSETKKGIKPSAGLSKQVERAVVQTLLENNSEYKNNYDAMPKKNTPLVKLWPYESHPYFKITGKQPWSVKK
ncbi:MAG: hypothetical protein M1383_04295 [Patescibacteria group bacterium]|nr:hypothetical protein [Patescibacteria group bacterium]